MKWPSIVTTEDDLSEAKLLATRMLIDWINSTTEELTGLIHRDEKLAWREKEDEARALIAGGDVGPLVAAECGVTGEVPLELAHKIVSKADRYRSAVALLTGMRRDAEREIRDATTPAQASAAVTRAKSVWNLSK